MKDKLRVHTPTFEDLPNRMAVVGLCVEPSCEGEWSPPQEAFERSQREYDAVCEWLKKVEHTLPEKFEVQLLSSASPPRPAVSTDLSWVFREFDKEVELDNGTQKMLALLRRAAEKSSSDAALILLLPWLTALALGLPAREDNWGHRLLRDEVNPAMSAALDAGLEVTALHNHFFYKSPRVMYMHIGGSGTLERPRVGQERYECG